jgi:hypothetical protein
MIDQLITLLTAAIESFLLVKIVGLQARA